MPLDMPREISSNRVVLRCPCTENASKLFTLVDHSRGHLSPYLDWVDHTKSTADSNEYLIKCQEMWEKGTKFDYSIFLKDTDEIIGQVGLFSIEEDHNHAEVGYWISSSYQGQGLMGSALRAITQAAFDAGLHRLEIRVHVDNKRSITVARRCGFKEEGIARECQRMRGVYCDHVVLARLSTDD